jgi:hypothetical protein
MNMITIINIPSEWFDRARRLDGMFADLYEPKEYEYLIETGLLRRTYDLLGVDKLWKTFC